MSDLQRIIDKINFVRAQGYITQAEAQDLKERARSKANAKGNLSDDEKRSLNKRLDDALNKKGKEDKKDGGFEIPKPDKKPDKDDKKPDKDDKKPGKDDKKPGKDDKKPGGRETDLSKFIDRVNAAKGLSNSDKEQLRKEARKRASGSGDFGAGDRKFLNELFDKLLKKKVPPTPTPTPEPTPTGPIDTDGDGLTDDIDPDDDNDNIPDEIDTDDDGDNIPDDEEYDDTPASGGPDPTVKGGGKKIDIPKPDSRANITLPKDAERIGMPNIDRKINKEIRKLTLQIMRVTKEFIEGGVDYSGIDYVSETEVLGDDGLPYYSLPDFNAPPQSDVLWAEERGTLIAGEIQKLLDKGDQTKTDRFNYEEYMDLFELRYNGAGEPFFRFSIELAGDMIDDLTVYLVEDEVIE